MIPFVLAEIRINEVMANPSCSESYCEYVELYNNDTNSVNMTGWKITDGDDEDVLEGGSGDEIIIPGNSFAMIVDSDSRVYSNFDVGEVNWIYVEDDSIANKLNNGGETLMLKDNKGDEIDSVTYPSLDEGESYNYINGRWEKGEATPGRDNIANTTSVNDYSVISISEFLPDPEGEDDANMPKGEWVELYNVGNVDLDLLGFEFYDNYGSEADVVITETTTSDGTVIKSKDYLVVYMNGVSGFLNNKGFEKISLYDLNGNLVDEVSYEGSDEGVSWSYSEEEWQRTAPTLGYGNLDNSSSMQSEIKIEEIYDLGDGKAEWGDIIRIKLFVYKGNTEKNVVWMWVEDREGNRVTKKSKFNVYDKFLNYSFTYPLGLPADCEEDFVSGVGKIKVSGLDTSTEENLDIRERPLCKDGTKKLRVSKFEYEVVDFEKEIEDNSEFTTKVRVKNNQKEELKVDIWSYVYSGKKHYVKESDEENAQTLTLESGGEEVVELKNEIEGISEAKSPRLKINILKEDRKTPYSITKELEVVESESVKKGFNQVTGNVIYENKDVKAERSAVFFFSGLMMTLGIYSFLRKWK